MKKTNFDLTYLVRKNQFHLIPTIRIEFHQYPMMHKFEGALIIGWGSWFFMLFISRNYKG